MFKKFVALTKQHKNSYVSILKLFSFFFEKKIKFFQ